MTQRAAARDVGEWDVAFEVYGARARVGVPDPELAAQVVERFPRHAIRRDPQSGDHRFELARASDGYAVVDDGVVRAAGQALDDALARLRYELFYYATHHARDHLVVSAAVVGHEGRAIVLLGSPRGGKTVLLAALLRAGAVYYADDWGVFDEEGQALAYPTTFRLDRKKLSAASLGAVTGETPIPVGLIVRAPFVQDARWDPQRRTRAQGAAMLLGHAYGMDDPRAAMRIAHRAAAHALVVEGERGEAAEAAAGVLELARQAPLGGSS